MGLEKLLSTFLCLNASCSLDNITLKSTELSPKSLLYSRLAEQLNGKHLRIGTIDNYPLSFTENENGALIGRGIAFEFVRILQKKFNFTYEVIVPGRNWEGAYGRLDNSLLGLLNESETIDNGEPITHFLETIFIQKVDFAAAFLPVLTESRKVVSFSHPIDEGTWMMIMKRPRESAAGSGLLAPFEQNVWYLILVAVVAYGPCIYIMTHFRYKMTNDPLDKPISMSPCVWFVYGAIIKQGTTLSPYANSTRVLFATWWLFIILVSAFYTANLTAFLTLSKFTLPIEDPIDLYQKSYKWLATEGSAVEYVVTNPDEKLYYLNKMVTTGLGTFISNTDFSTQLARVSRGAVFVRDSPAADLALWDDYRRKASKGVAEKDRCTFVITANYFMKFVRGFAYPMGSTLTILFDPIIRALVESGIVKFLKNRNVPTNKICPRDLQSKERRLRNSDLIMTYMLALIGLAAALAVFIGEVFVRRFITKRYDNSSTITRVTPSKKSNTFMVNSKSEKFDDTQPPPYESIFGFAGDTESSKRQVINGRDYWVIKSTNGDVRLVPVRAPSAFLFQYSS